MSFKTLGNKHMLQITIKAALVTLKDSNTNALITFSHFQLNVVSKENRIRRHNLDIETTTCPPSSACL